MNSQAVQEITIQDTNNKLTLSTIHTILYNTSIDEGVANTYWRDPRDRVWNEQVFAFVVHPISLPIYIEIFGHFDQICVFV